MNKPLGKLVKVDLRYWKHEASEFTPWLAHEENLKLLGETLGLELELTGTEQCVGDFNADIVAKDSDSGEIVIIENQLEWSDHKHLGQLLTYASGLGAKTVVWIASQIRDDHRQALNWLNNGTNEQVSFFGLEIELWRIGDSPPAPKFNVVCQPNSWQKRIATSVERAAGTAAPGLEGEFWTQFQQFCNDSGTFLRKGRVPSKAGYGYRILTGIAVAKIKLRVVKRLKCQLRIGGRQVYNYFQKLDPQKSQIESELGSGQGEIKWNHKEGRFVKIDQYGKDTDLNSRNDWPEYFTWLKERAESFHRVLVPRLKALRSEEEMEAEEEREEEV